VLVLVLDFQNGAIIAQRPRRSQRGGGVVEWWRWSDGVVEWWSDGVME
jgi:hypothetical protein